MVHGWAGSPGSSNAVCKFFALRRDLRYYLCMKIVVAVTTPPATDTADLSSLRAPPLRVTVHADAHRMEVCLEDAAPSRAVPFRLQGRRPPPDGSPLGGLARFSGPDFDARLEGDGTRSARDNAEPKRIGRLGNFDDL